MSFDLHITTIDEFQMFVDIILNKGGTQFIRNQIKELKDESTKLDTAIINNANDGENKNG